MNIVLAIVIFSIVLFFYLHIFYQLKTSNDLEIYEIENPSKDKLEEICDIRQPVLFNFTNENIQNQLNHENISKHYYSFDIKIRKNTYNSQNKDKNGILYVPILLKTANALLNKNNKNNSNYISENNSDFLNETGLIKTFKYNDEFLRPYLLSHSSYDYLFGSKNTFTPFRYHKNYRNFFTVTKGEITVKLTIPDNSKYLYTNKDYQYFEFRSPVNPWDVQEQYKADFSKIKCLEITLKPGQMLYIPAYWWYSIKYNEKSSIACFYYKSYMNTLAILPDTIISFLQNANIKRKRYIVKNTKNTRILKEKNK